MDLRLGPERHTYTIIGRCDRTQGLGVGIATFSLAAGGYCPRVVPGVGAMSSQAFADPRLLPEAFAMLERGLSAQAVLDKLSEMDPYFAYRQIGLVDATGNAAAHTGGNTSSWCGHVCGPGYVAMGNCLAGEQTVTAIEQGFLSAPELDLEERLLRGIESGRDAGGQASPMTERSAALIVYENESYARVDLRVDLHDDAVVELRRAYDAYLPYIPLYYDLRVKRPDQAPAQLKWIRDKGIV